MTAPTVPTAPALCNVPEVELMHVGQWDISTGTTTFTSDDLRSAVAALDCPAVRRPVLKLGHTDPRFDGEPAIGSVQNLGLASDDRTLVGDYVGMPGWIGPVLASAYPDRSIEGWFDFTCQLGHVHPFVLTAVALLGVTPPGIGTLASLQDVATLYGVAASAEPTVGTSVAVTVHASRGGQPVPNPSPTKVAATATTEDVRRAFYDDAPWSQWIEEIQLEPLQLIVIDDENGQRFRVPVTVDAADDGEDAVSFGQPTPVVIRYEDQAAVAASGAPRRIAFASRAESRPAASPDAPETPAAEPPVTPTHTTEEADSMSDTLNKGLRERLGVADDADEATILAALDEALTERADPTPEPGAIPSGSVVVSNDMLEELKIAARAGQEARGVQLRQQRDDTIAAAIRGGHIAPARRDHWSSKWDADPEGVAASISELTSGEPIFPVAASGYAGNEPVADPAAGTDYWFPGVPAATVAKEG